MAMHDNSSTRRCAVHRPAWHRTVQREVVDLAGRLGLHESVKKSVDGGSRAAAAVLGALEGYCCAW